MNKIYLFIFAVFHLLSCASQSAPLKTSSISDNVQILDQPMIIKGLDRERQIRIFVPDGYQESGKTYPVLYMHDGQNLFDDSTSFAGEWAVDEALHAMKMELIVVGIDNGGEKRMNEMGPWDHEEFGESETDEYLDFIVHQIKPHIDSTFRTKSDRSNTAMLGSSMGGLVTHYAILSYPEVFGKAGIFSPSYWYSDEIFALTKKTLLPEDSKIYIIVGSKEGSNMERPAKQMYQTLIDSGHPKDRLFFDNVRGGQHGEKFWKEAFPGAIKWLFN